MLFSCVVSWVLTASSSSHFQIRLINEGSSPWREEGELDDSSYGGGGGGGVDESPLVSGSGKGLGIGGTLL